MDIREKTVALIDELKATCQSAGLGNDGNEFKIITQVFLYKFLNDKFGYTLKNKDTRYKAKFENVVDWEGEYATLSEDEQKRVCRALGADCPNLYSRHLITQLWNQQAKGDFDVIFDSTMKDIAAENMEIFSTLTVANTKIPIFEPLTQYVTDDSQRTPFARALVDNLAKFSFEEAFSHRYDFFAGIFEYLIQDYNTAGGGKYAEYYTPHAIATIMARLLVGDNSDLHNIECYDPSAGTGTLLMALAHQIGEERCTIFSQDISQRSNKMLKLNLILNNLVSSLDHVIQGDTLVNPYHKSDDGKELRQFDFVVSNPPFKMDFSDTREKIAAMPARFWAGVPSIPNKKKDSMAIYTCFIQHVINSIKDKGKGAIVIPTGFITAKSSIENKILQKIIDDRIVWGVVSMPSNVFANTGTNVSVLFFDKSKSSDKVILIDASKLGEEYKDSNGLKKRRLTNEEIEKIVKTFRNKDVVEDFSVAVTYDEIKEKGYVLSAGQYFDIKIEYVDITEEAFNSQMKADMEELNAMFTESHKLEEEIQKQLASLKFCE
ncbi:MAG: class I SAM-dependent DNA methyltransferase [Treponemataceae bacterium]|nr:class I SAM-dependent DNA methyltransferase [Treponemataceae bacterium]